MKWWTQSKREHVSSRTHHPLPQDQAVRGTGADLQLDGFRRVRGATSQNVSINKNDSSLDVVLFESGI